MAAKFVVKKGPTGKFRFSLHGKNGRVITSSAAYNSKAACLNGIKAVKAAAGGADIEDQTTKTAAKAPSRPSNRRPRSRPSEPAPRPPRDRPVRRGRRRARLGAGVVRHSWPCIPT